MKSIHNTMKFMDDKIEELLVKKVDGELSAKEEEFLSLWLAEDVEHERELQVLWRCVNGYPCCGKSSGRIFPGVYNW